MKFPAYIDNGKLKMSNFYASKFAEDIAKNPKARYEVVRLTPESRNMRRYFEGCLVPLVTFYQDNLDYRNSKDRDKVRGWLKQEFIGESVAVNGIIKKVAISSKGELKKLVEATMDWLIENYAPPQEAVSPSHYSDWRDTIYPNGGPDTYIGFLVETGVLK